jgi:thiol-disulfide isomerase/thioredoxin
MQTITRGLPLLFVCALLMFGLVGCEVDQNIFVPVDDRTALDFDLRTVDDGVRDMSCYLGDVVLINFWDTWCGPCRHEIPDLNELYLDYRHDGVTVIGIALGRDGMCDVQDFADDYDIAYTCGIFDEHVAELFNRPTSLPTTLVVNCYGEVVSTVVGYHSYDYWSGVVNTLLED